MSELFDQFHRPISSRGLYPSILSHPRDSRPKPIIRPKIYENQTSRERWEQVNYSMILATKVTGIDAALTMKANYVVGDAWHVSHQSDNPFFAEKAEQLFNENYYRNCNIIGQAHDWHSSLKTICRAFDVQGDFGVWFDGADTKDRQATGQFQILDYSRIGTGVGTSVNVGNGLEQCKELGNAPLGYQQWGYASGWGSFLPYYIIRDTASPFNGMRIIDGIIVDQNLRTAGYRVLGYNDAGLPTYADVPAAMIHFNYEVGDWINQLRGIPKLANLLDDANSVSDIQYYWQQGIQLASQKMVWRESVDARSGSNIEETTVAVQLPDGTTKNKLVAIEDAPAGLVEMSTKNGEKLGTLDLNRPSMEERSLVSLLETAYFHKHWPRPLIHTEDLNRAPARAITQQVQIIVRQRQMSIERTARFIADRRIELGMRRGELPNNTNLYDPYNYAFSLPGKFTIDEGNDGKMMLTMLGRGTISRGIICNDMGVQEKKILKSNVASVEALAKAAEGIAAKHDWMTEMEALNRLDNNGNVNQPSQQEPDAGETPPNSKAVNPAPDKKPEISATPKK